MARRILAVIAALAGMRVLWLFVQLAHGWGGVRAYHLEAASVLFVVASVALLLARRRDQPSTSAAQAGGLPSWRWLAPFIAAALLLYWPVLSLGFLSDDFVLMNQVRRGDIGFASPILFRPVVLGSWAALQTVGASAWIFHAINVLLHGVVSFLTMRLTAAWVPGRWPTLAAGVVVLTLPTAVEPVAWISGAFDPAASAFALGAVLIARGYSDRTAAGRRVVLLLCLLGAVLSNETGAVAAVMVLIDAWMRGRLHRQLVVDSIALSVAAGAYLLWRSTAIDAQSFEITKYSLQRVLFQTFGTFAQPWSDATRAHPMATAALGAIVVIVFLFALTAVRRQVRTPTGCVALTLCAVAPLAGWLFIGSSLDGSRYLYLAAPGWAALVVCLVSGAQGRAVRAITMAAFAVVIAANGWATGYRIQAWANVAGMRDAILTSANANDGLRKCSEISIRDLPDTVDGVYVFRNGAREAFASAGLPRVVDPASDPACVFRWDGRNLR